MLSSHSPRAIGLHQSSLMETAMAQASATIALVQVRNAIRALCLAPPPTEQALIRDNAEANLRILEQCIETGLGGASAPDPRQLALFEGARG